ncbi:MAG: DUF1579 family protein [Phycisphaerae bacterium]
MMGLVRQERRWGLASVALLGFLAMGGSLLVGASPDANPEAQSLAFERLAMYLGPWIVTERHLDPRGNITATVDGTEEVTWLYADRAIRRAYMRTDESSSYRASGFLTYDAAEKRYEGVWFNNQATDGPINVSGTWNKNERTMVYSLTRRVGDQQEELFRITETFTSEKQRESVTYAVKDNKLIKLMEVQYVRTTPCPAKVRGLFTN